MHLFGRNPAPQPEPNPLQDMRALLQTYTGLLACECGSDEWISTIQMRYNPIEVGGQRSLAPVRPQFYCVKCLAPLPKAVENLNKPKDPTNANPTPPNTYEQFTS